MEIFEVLDNKKKYLDLLLEADEEESMVDKYIERGRVFVLCDKEIIGQAVVTKESQDVYEIKNIAVYEKFRKKGYGKIIINYIENLFDDCKTLYVGTGDSPSTINFYEKCGFEKSHVIKNFFTDNYSKPIIENGKVLKDMIYLKKEIKRP